MRRLGRRAQVLVLTGAHGSAPAAALTLFLALTLSGCAGGLGSLITKSPPAAYDLKAANDFGRRSGSVRGQLVVAEPIALAAYDSEKIIVRPSPGLATQMGDAQWQDRLPKLMQARILQSFANDGLLRAVGRPAERIATDFTLVTEVHAFEMSAAEGGAVVEIAAKIVRDRTGRVMAARVFRAVVPASAMEGGPAVAALNEGFGKVARELVLWAAKVV